MFAPERVEATWKNIRRLAMERRHPLLPALSRAVPDRTRIGFLWLAPKRDQRHQGDLIAQIALYLLNAKLLREPSRAQIEGWLSWYLTGRFRLTDLEASRILQA